MHLESAAVGAQETEGQVVVGKHAPGDLGDLSEHRLHVEGARQRGQQRLERLLLLPSLLGQRLQEVVLDGQGREVGDGLERARVRRAVDVRLAVDEPKNADLPRVTSEGQHQRRAKPVLHERSVARICDIELPRRVADDDGNPPVSGQRREE